MWCCDCHMLVTNLSRHRQRHHASLPYQRPATSLSKVNTPLLLQDCGEPQSFLPAVVPPEEQDETSVEFSPGSMVCSQTPPTPTFHSAASDREEWLHEPLCSVLPPGDDEARSGPPAVPSSSLPPQEPEIAVLETFDAAPSRDVAAQADGDVQVRTRSYKVSLAHFPLLRVVPPGDATRRGAATQTDGCLLYTSDAADE